MANFDVLVVDTSKWQRESMADDVNSKHRHPRGQTFFAANALQAKKYFEGHRETARNVCLFSATEMNHPNYDLTNLPLPFPGPKDSLGDFETLVKDAETWSQETGKQCFIVRRSASDSIKDASNIDDLNSWSANNFDKPFILTKLALNETANIGKILAHCDKIFSIEPAEVKA